ncbi:MAG: NUDIX domain-containing protein [Bdellovibrionales bacterium]|nr:NUDIX domain-containing protein [Bdellovibrionales bacterium]
MKSRVTKSEIISDVIYTFKKVTFELELKEGKWESQCREVFDRGNGATILLYNPGKQTVILTKQFRIPTYLNGNTSGMMIEACAGSIEDESPEVNITRETEEETGYAIKSPRKIFEAYMSPAAVTEILYFFIAEYDESMKINAGGGMADEHEHIEVMEVKFAQAISMVKSGEIKDGKTIMLLQYAQLNDLL